MKTLYESIISNTRIGNKAKFADDLEFQRKEIVRLLNEFFNIDNTYEKYKGTYEYQFSCVVNKKELDKKVRLLETILTKYDYFEKMQVNTHVDSIADSITLALYPPPTKENLFPSIYIKFAQHITFDYNILNVDISITDNRDYMFDWIKLFNKL